MQLWSLRRRGLAINATRPPDRGLHLEPKKERRKYQSADLTGFSGRQGGGCTQKKESPTATPELEAIRKKKIGLIKNSTARYREGD